MARLPQPGGDDGNWGDVLNTYLAIAHNADGTLKNDTVSTGAIQADAVTPTKIDASNTPSTGHLLAYDGAGFEWVAGSSGGGTNITATPSATTVVVASDTGTDATLASATGSNAGVLTAADKTKLDGIATGAQVNTVTSVATKTGAVTLVKADVGLGNVDNTADTAKPVSTATQTALDGKAATVHTHVSTGITDFNEAVEDIIGAKVIGGTNVTIGYNDSTGETTVNASGGSGTTNLAATRNGTSVTVTSDTGTDATLAAADASNAGVMVAADKSKLDGIASGAQVNTVTSVATKTGAVTLVKADVGLGNVDNTADTAKPVSTATQTALDGKLAITSVPAAATIPAFIKWNGSSWPARTTATSSSSVVVFWVGGTTSPADMVASDIWLREGS